MFGRRLYLIIVLAALLATCAACGGDGGKEATSPPTAQPATAQPATAQPATAQPATVAPKESAAPSGAATLALDKTTLTPNEEFQVRFTAPGSFTDRAWIGTIPSDVPHGDEAVNDEYDIDYRYLDVETREVMTITTPWEPGSYDLRLNDSAGRETASVTFIVAVPAGDVEPSLRLDKTTFAPGEEVLLYFTAPSWYPLQAWIGLIPSDVPHDDETVNDEYDIDYRYLEGQTSGTMTFTAPEEPGSYDLRMNDTDQNGKEVASITFTVE